MHTEADENIQYWTGWIKKASTEECTVLSAKYTVQSAQRSVLSAQCSVLSA